MHKNCLSICWQIMDIGLFSPRIIHPRIIHLRKIPPRFFHSVTFHSRIIHPRKIYPVDFSPPAYLPQIFQHRIFDPRVIHPRITRPRILPPKQFTLENNFQPNRSKKNALTNFHINIVFQIIFFCFALHTPHRRLHLQVPDALGLKLRPTGCWCWVLLVNVFESC